MRFMILRKADKNTEAGILPDEKVLAAMVKYNEEGVKAGIMRAGEGLHPSSQGTRVKFSAGKPTGNRRAFRRNEGTARWFRNHRREIEGRGNRMDQTLACRRR